MKRTIANSCSDEEFATIVSSVTSARKVAKILGFAAGGGAVKGVRRRIAKLNLDTSHFVYLLDEDGKAQPNVQSVLTDRSPRHRRKAIVKRKLIESGLLENKCDKCGLGPEWDGESLDLQLHTIDGNLRNHSIENLRILCPNCYQQVFLRNALSQAGKRAWPTRRKNERAAHYRALLES